MIPEYTTVLGVDEKHFGQFKLSIPTWIKHKPKIFRNPIIIFSDDWATRLKIVEFLKSVETPRYGWSADPIKMVQWPPEDVVHQIEEKDRFSNLQRYRMLSGFVHVPASYVKTPYWLKLDLDVLATGKEDWIDPDWFVENPAIVAPAWSYTKPANQMILLDEWVSRYSGSLPSLLNMYPLDLKPNPGSDLVRHSRIISWCAFFQTEFTKECSEFAEKTCGTGMLPVPSQDGYQFYVAKRLNRKIQTVKMKSFGWNHCSSEKKMREVIQNG